MLETERHATVDLVSDPEAPLVDDPFVTPCVSLVLTAVSITASSSGKALSVIIARGRFSSPRGQARSRQNPRKYSTTLSI